MSLQWAAVMFRVLLQVRKPDGQLDAPLMEKMGCDLLVTLPFPRCCWSYQFYLSAALDDYLAYPGYIRLLCWIVKYSVDCSE